MTCLNYISFLRMVHLSGNVYKTKSPMKKIVDAFCCKRVLFRTYTNSPNIIVNRSNVKAIECSRPKLNYGPSRKIIILKCRQLTLTLESLRYIHTSDRRNIHPVLWAVFRPALKLMAVLTGRAFRKWWRDLPPNKKKYFLQALKENKNKLSLFALMFLILSVSYYVSHIEETPITKRKRFIAFNSKQLEKINQFEFQQLILKMQKHILPVNHPSTRRVQAVVDQIVKANWDIKEVRGKKWGVAIINSSIENAFVLPNGYVCVFTGMLSLCSTDDELGIILSHEIAHCIQGHGAENISFAHLLDLISVLIIAAIWAVVPSDILSLFTHWLYSTCMKILFELPYNRKIETEADTVGLQLAAKACFDVRESSAFWAKMAILQNSMNAKVDIEFLSTHPSHETRSEYLDSIMDKAIQYRNECGCPKLKQTDPRLNIEIMAKALEAARRKFLQQFPKPSTPFPF